MNKLTQFVVASPPVLMVIGGIGLLPATAMAFAAPGSADAATPDHWRLIYLLFSCLPIGVVLSIYTAIMTRLDKHNALWLNVIVMGLWLVLCVVFAVRAGVGL